MERLFDDFLVLKLFVMSFCFVGTTLLNVFAFVGTILLGLFALVGTIFCYFATWNMVYLMFFWYLKYD